MNGPEINRLSVQTNENSEYGLLRYSSLNLTNISLKTSQYAGDHSERSGAKVRKYQSIIILTRGYMDIIYIDSIKQLL